MQAVLPPRKKQQPQEEKPEKEFVQPDETDVQAVEDQEGIRPMAESAAMCKPANSSKDWKELAMVNLDAKIKPKQAYEMYLAICKKHNVMMRTFRSFQQKRKTLMSGK